MITREEFLNALSIVNAYKAQVFTEAKTLSVLLEDNNLTNLNINPESFIYQSDMSSRMQNALYWYIRTYVKKIEWTEYKTFKFKDLDGIDLSKLSQVRNVGKKTTHDLASYLIQAGIKFIL